MNAPTTRLIATLVLMLGLSASAFAASPLLKQFEDAFIELSDELRLSVVEISATEKGSEMDDLQQFNIGPDTNPRELQDLFRFFRNSPEENRQFNLGPDTDPQEIEDFLRRFRNSPEGNRQPEGNRGPRRRASTGSGFIFDAQGHIVTNNHVVQGATTLEVTLYDGSTHEATVVGTDPSADLAVIRIDPEGLSLVPCKLGDSDKLKIGQFAVVMGSPNGLTGSISYGHISGLGREELRLPDRNLRFQDFIQTDAGINLGNSGGPLCNIDGEVIGVNIAIVYGANSIGFAIPVNRVKEIVPQLIANGKVVRGWLGVSIMNVDEEAEQQDQDLEDYLQAYNLPDARGAFVVVATPDGPANKAGLVPDDVIRKIDGIVVEDKIDLIARISALAPGSTVALEVWRAGKSKKLDVVLGEFTDMATARFGAALLGLRVSDIPAGVVERLGMDGVDGVMIMDVVQDSPAGKAGLRSGQVIIEIAHRKVEGKESFKELMRSHARGGETLLLRVLVKPGTVERKFLKVPEGFEVP